MSYGQSVLHRYTGEERAPSLEPPRIPFDGEVWDKAGYSMLDHGALRDIVLDPDVPFGTRLLKAAEWRVDNRGHAHFESGELARLLSEYAEPGTPVPADGRRVQRRIDALVDGNLVQAGSHSRCLNLRQHYAVNRSGWAKAGPCPPRMGRPPGRT